MDTNAANETGVLSPYGEFFPTDAGEIALLTMPDIDTGARGTGVVSVLKLQLDASRRKRTYFIIYTILCTLLPINAAGCRAFWFEFQHIQ